MKSAHKTKKAPRRKSTLLKKEREKTIWNDGQEEEVFFDPTTPIRKEKEQISDVQKCIEFAEREIGEKHEEMSRIAKMYQTLQDIKRSPHFNEEEVQIYRESYNYYISQHNGLFENVVKAIETAKQLWGEKKEFLCQKFNEGVLDDEVCKRYSKIMDNYERKITKLNTIAKSLSS